MVPGQEISCQHSDSMPCRKVSKSPLSESYHAGYILLPSHFLVRRNHFLFPPFFDSSVYFPTFFFIVALSLFFLLSNFVFSASLSLLNTFSLVSTSPLCVGFQSRSISWSVTFLSWHDIIGATKQFFGDINTFRFFENIDIQYMALTISTLFRTTASNRSLGNLPGCKGKILVSMKSLPDFYFSFPLTNLSLTILKIAISIDHQALCSFQFYHDLPIFFPCRLKWSKYTFFEKPQLVC